MIYLGPKESKEANFSRKVLRPGENNLALFASSYRLWQTSSNIYLGSKGQFGKYGTSYKMVFQHLRGCWNQKFCKERLILLLKDLMAYFFSIFRVWKTSRNNF